MLGWILCCIFGHPKNRIYHCQVPPYGSICKRCGGYVDE